MDFPCFMYHAQHGASLFENREAFEEAGEGWVDSPAKCEPASLEIPGSVSIPGNAVVAGGLGRKAKK